MPGIFLIGYTKLANFLHTPLFNLAITLVALAMCLSIFNVKQQIVSDGKAQICEVICCGDVSLKLIFWT